MKEIFENLSIKNPFILVQTINQLTFQTKLFIYLLSIEKGKNMGGEYIRGKHLDDQNKNKNINTFVGILHGVLSDGRLKEEEVKYLLEWIGKNKQGLDIIPLFHQLHRKLTEYSSGGINTEEEHKLIAMIRLLTGNNWSVNGDVSNMPINLYDKDPSIYFEDRVFCFTGEFEFGSKRMCQEAIENLGGIYSENMTQDVNYLVVGKEGSKDWKYGNWGTKISKASDWIKSEDFDMTIISEDDWRVAMIMDE